MLSKFWQGKPHERSKRLHFDSLSDFSEMREACYRHKVADGIGVVLEDLRVAADLLQHHHVPQFLVALNEAGHVQTVLRYQATDGAIQVQDLTQRSAVHASL